MQTKPDIVRRLRKLKKRELSNPNYDLDDYEEDIELYGETVYNELTDEYILEDAENTINLDGVNLMDIYFARYNYINIFFMVAKTKCHEVALYELETKVEHCSNDKNVLYETLVEDFKPRRRPYIISKNNCWTKTDYWVKSNIKKGFLYVKTTPSSPICQLDIARGRDPIYTTLKCVKIPIDILVKKFHSLIETPFPVDNLADWPKENEIIRKEIAEA